MVRWEVELKQQWNVVAPPEPFVRTAQFELRDKRQPPRGNESVIDEIWLVTVMLPVEACASLSPVFLVSQRVVDAGVAQPLKPGDQRPKVGVSSGIPPRVRVEVADDDRATAREKGLVMRQSALRATARQARLTAAVVHCPHPNDVDLPGEVEVNWQEPLARRVPFRRHACGDGRLCEDT